MECRKFIGFQNISEPFSIGGLSQPSTLKVTLVFREVKVDQSKAIHLDQFRRSMYPISQKQNG